MVRKEGELMLLKNKKTDRIETFEAAWHLKHYASLKDFCRDWEDAPEEPKNNRTWFLDFSNGPDFVSYGDNPITDPCYDDWNELGICFETKEEAEEAVNRLRAWKRLKDGGFEFSGIGFDEHGRIYVKTSLHVTELNAMENPGLKSRLNLLFGGE